MKKILRYIAVILVVIMSGANTVLNVYIPDKNQQFFFLAYSLLFYFIMKGYASKKSWLTLIGICFWIFFNQNLIQSDGLDNNYLTYIMDYIATFFIVSSFDFENFRKKLLVVIQILATVSIIAHELYWLRIIPGVYHEGDAISFTLAWNFFNVEWGENRLASIFWEPGQFQIILNFVFVLCSKDVVNLVREQRYGRLVIRYGILLLALILTKSTTGYISFAIYCAFIMLNLINKKHIIIGLVGSALVIIGISTLLQSDTVQDKFESGNNSYLTRMADNLGLLYMIQTRPIVGYGIQTRKYVNTALSTNNLTSSNGWLNAGAQLGVPFLLVLIFLVGKGVYRLRDDKLFLVLFLVVFIAQANEAKYFLPFLTLFIFPFKDQIRITRNTIKKQKNTNNEGKIS